MKNKILQIMYKLSKGEIKYNLASKQVLDLFAVSGSCEWCGTAKENPNGLCKECGRFPSPSNYR